MIFLDTSVLYALADSQDGNHSKAVDLFRSAIEDDEVLLLHNYILVETAALVQRRLGLQPALEFLRDSEGFQVHWVSADEHRRAIDLLALRNNRGIGFVDCASFIVMRLYSLTEVMAFDDEFTAEGFTLYSDGDRDK